MFTEILDNGTHIYCEKPHTFGEDALLLARFANVKPSDTAIDVGTGCGVIALTWHDEGHKGLCTALDISGDAVSLVQTAVTEQNIQHIEPVCADIRSYKTTQVYDVMACNPPYFVNTKQSENEQRAAQRHEVSCNINDVCAAANRLLKNGGRLCVCMKPERLADVFCAMRDNKIEPKRLCAVCSAKDYSPRLYLIEGGKSRKPGLKVMPPIIK